MNENSIAKVIVDSALQVHRRLGPGLLESVYETTLAYEIQRRGLNVVRQFPIPIVYDEIVFPDPFRVDLLVGEKVLIELKSVEELEPVHFRQTITYLKLAKLQLGFLINFNVSLLKDGVHRLVNGLPE